MRVIFFGTAEFAVPSLRRLVSDTDIEVNAVITQPDRPAGRGNRLTPPPVKQMALEFGLPIYQPERLRRDEAVIALLADAQADFFVVAAYGQILPQRVLDLPRKGCINVHGSLLPQYRGAAPVQWALYYGEAETGVTTMLMDAGLDTGAMLLKAKIPIAPEANGETLMADLARLGADLLIETLHRFDQITPEAQDDTLSSYAPLVDKARYAIDWQQDATQVRNQIRAFYPYVYTLYRGERMRILASELIEIDSIDLPPGAIIRTIKSAGVAVATGAGSLLLTEVQPAGGRRQSAWDWANGNPIAAGERLGE